MIHRDQVEKKLGKCNGIKLRQTERKSCVDLSRERVRKERVRRSQSGRLRILDTRRIIREESESTI